VVRLGNQQCRDDVTRGPIVVVLLVLVVLMYCFFRYCERQRRDEKTEDLVHSLSDVRIRKRIPLQSVPDEEAANRDSTRLVPDRKTDKDLVSESADEVEKRT
jgi:hypothetical protein